MKNIIFTLIAMFTISLGYSQDSKAYLGVSLGIAIPGSDVGEDHETKIDLGFINFGYRFSEKWGATLNLTSSGHAVEDTDGDVVTGVAYWNWPHVSIVFLIRFLGISNHNLHLV